MIKRLMIGLVMLVVVAAVIISFSIDGIVKSAIEQSGSKLLGAKVTVQSVQLSLLSGSGEISGVQIDNPVGFKAPYAFKLGKVKVNVSLPSLLQDVIVVNSVAINQPNIMVETNGNTSNIQAMLSHITVVTKGSESAVVSKKHATIKSQSKSAEPTYIIIHHFALTKPIVNGNLGGLATVKMDIPDVVLNNIGVAPKGVTTSGAMKRIVQALSQSLAHAKTTVKTTKQGQEIGAMLKGVGDLLHKH